MRILGLARQSSKDKKRDVTIDRQVADITAGCADLGHVLVDVARDEHVSGKFSPFDPKRKSGAWLSEPAQLAQWDALMITDRDRLDRDVAYRIGLFDWCQASGKDLLLADGRSILPRSADDRHSEISLANGHEHYRRVCGEKRAKTARYLKRQGKLNGGDYAVPYGYARGADGFPVIVPAEAEVLRRIAGQVLKGSTLTEICAALNAERVPTRRGGAWATSAVSRMLTRLSEPYARAANGDPFFYPEIITPVDLGRVRAKLAERSFRKAPKASTDRHDSTLLLRVAFCAEGHPLYSFTTKGNRDRSTYVYYRCHVCKGKMVRMDVLEQLAGDFITGQLGPLPYMTPVFTPATGPGEELADVVRRMDDIEAQIVTGSLPAASAGRMLAALQARRDELGAVPVTEARTELRRTGKTVEQEWSTGDRARRRKMLTDDLRVRLTVWHEGGKLRVKCECDAMVFDTWLYAES